MNIAITGSTSGVGKELYHLLESNHNVISLSRQILELSDLNQVINFDLQKYDVLINCAGTGVGGKIEFCKHNLDEIKKIMSVNLISPMLLAHQALSSNPECKIINITSTNNKRYWPNDLAYSLSKISLHNFSEMLRVEYPNANILEVQLGLTKTNFNQNRYKNHRDRYQDIYNNKHLQADFVAEKIYSVLFDNSIKFIEISP
jgi:short-subunit dehydrogenase